MVAGIRVCVTSVFAVYVVAIVLYRLQGLKLGFREKPGKIRCRDAAVPAEPGERAPVPGMKRGVSQEGGHAKLAGLGDEAAEIGKAVGVSIGDSFEAVEG